MAQIGYVGRSRLEAARRLLPAAVSAWRKQWCFGAEDVGCLPVLTLTENDTDEMVASATRGQQACTAQGSIWLGARTETCWQHLLFGQQSPHVPADETAIHLCQKAQLALANALLLALHQHTVPALADVALVTPGASHPSVRLSITGPDTHILILLEASLLDAWLPLPPARVALLTRQQAIGVACVPVRLRLPLSTVSVSSLADLRPGDILRLTTPLTQHFSLETDGGVLIAKGVPVSANGQFAVQLIDR